MSRHFTLSFQKLAVAVSVLILAFAFTSCGDKNADRFKEAAMNLDNTEFTLEYEYDYWPDGGIRNIGGHLSSLISLSQLEKMLPCPLYVSGPHQNGEWDLYSDDFGHYNPEAIQYLADLAEKVVSDKKFVKLSFPLVDRYLGTQMHYMMVLHDAMYDEELFDEEARDLIFNDIREYYGNSDDAYYVTGNLALYDENYIYENFKIEMLYFWARRWIDGTIDQFYDALSTVYMAYYPEYQYTTDDYWYYDDYYEGDYYEETEYDCELEPDEPITDKERIKEKDAIDMIKTATAKLDESVNVMPGEFDYWPECGLRITASHLFSLVSLRTLNRMLPCDLYVSGPHYTNRWNFNDPWDFGHYNPEAIQYLNKLATKIVSDKKFVDRTRPLVEKNLKRQMFILRSLYNALGDKELCPDKEAVFDDCMSSQGYCWDAASDFMDQLDIEDGTYVWGNTGNMFLYWWARRNADGTMELFHEGLETIYNAYFPEE